MGGDQKSGGTHSHTNTLGEMHTHWERHNTHTHTPYSKLFRNMSGAYPYSPVRVCGGYIWNITLLKA